MLLKQDREDGALYFPTLVGVHGARVMGVRGPRVFKWPAVIQTFRQKFVMMAAREGNDTRHPPLPPTKTWTGRQCLGDFFRLMVFFLFFIDQSTSLFTFFSLSFIISFNFRRM